ncbi:MAG: hypothetical protein AB7N76_28260 [Planctomycetota bacterium]
MRPPAALTGLACLALIALSGCVAPASKPHVATSRTTPVAAHIYVTRPLKLTKEPTDFVQGAVGSLREELVLNGYDSTGASYELETESEMLEDLALRNERLPGTAAIQLSFVEAPFGFAFIFASVSTRVLDPKGRILLEGNLDPPPRRELWELILPPRRPDVDGRVWMKRVWREVISLVLPRRRHAAPTAD